ncbi:MAG TPA: metallophosphoesterase [Rhabdochlamydiaceae bacterium]|nr:metallophosphoesterase [Rhabdochlamydiaceae bacterium]
MPFSLSKLGSNPFPRISINAPCLSKSSIALAGLVLLGILGGWTFHRVSGLSFRNLAPFPEIVDKALQVFWNIFFNPQKPPPKETTSLTTTTPGAPQKKSGPSFNFEEASNEQLLQMLEFVPDTNGELIFDRTNQNSVTKKRLYTRIRQQFFEHAEKGADQIATALAPLFALAKSDSVRFMFLVNLVIWDSEVCPQVTAAVLEKIEWPSETLKKKNLPAYLANYIRLQCLLRRNGSICIETPSPSGESPIFRTYKLLVRTKCIFEFRDFVTNPQPLSPFLVEGMGIAIQDYAKGIVEDLKQQYEAGKTDENTNIGFNLVIMPFAKKCRFPCTMLSPLLPYLKKLPGLVGLEMSDVGGSGLLSAEDSQQKGHAFSDEDAPALLDILKTNFHLFHIKIDINEMIKKAESKFAQEWQALVTGRQRPSTIKDFLALEAPKIVPSDSPSTSTVASLMDEYTKAWDVNNGSFQFPDDFDVNRFATLLTDHAKRFAKNGVDYKQHFGYIEKFDLDSSEKPQLYVRADLHGDLKSLIENLRTLQEQKLLDHNFKCQPGVHLVFLGDYCDRGVYGTQILEMLMRLREENPHQVHLIRGNHEYCEYNFMFGHSDTRLKAVVSDSTARKALERFYETMSLTTYFSVAGPQREYVQCTHGLFDPTMDPAPLLDQRASGDYLPVPKKREFSPRIQQIPNDNSELSQSAQKVKELVKSQPITQFTVTLYNWGDVTISDTSVLGNTESRTYRWCAQDIHHYFRISSQYHRVMILLRGHEHAFQHVKHKENVIVTTLTVGVDCPHQPIPNQSDRAYIITPAPKVENWIKKAILRAAGSKATDKITDSHPLVNAIV